MKKTFILLLLLAGMQAQAQRASVIARLKSMAATSAPIILRSGNINITRNTANWRAVTKNAIPFVAFELKDKSGNAVPPDRPVQIKTKDGRVLKTMTAREYIDQLNETEKNLNTLGYSLRTDRNVIVSRMISQNNFLSGKLQTLTRAAGPLRTEDQIQNYIRTPASEVKILYDPAAVKAAAEATAPPATNQPKNQALINAARTTGAIKNLAGYIDASRTVYAIDESKNKRFDFGDPATFQAGVECNLYRYAKINAYVNRLDTATSVMKFSASGRIWATVFNNSFNILDALAEVNVPTDPNKDMNANIYVKAGGTMLFSLPQSQYRQKMNWSKRFGNPFDNSYGVTIPIWGPLDFKGKIGIKGDVGFDLDVSLDRTALEVEGTPYGEFGGYAEVGLDIAGIAGIGVGGNLNILSGYLPAKAGLNITQKLERDGQSTVVYKRNFFLNTSYYLGYDVSMLNGNLYVYGELCVPDWVPFVGGDCARYTHDIFTWDGINDKGTFAEGSQSFIIATGGYTVPLSRAAGSQIKIGGR